MAPGLGIEGVVTSRTSCAVPVADFDAARRVLARSAVRCASLLAALPEPVRRTPVERADAAAAHGTARRARGTFLDRYAAAVYAELTDGRSRYLTLEQLCAAAAGAFPGLVPEPEALAADAGRVQADKEGYEIDQGIFVAGMLREPESGRHLLDAMRRPTQRALDLLDAFRRDGEADLGSVRLHRTGGVAHLTMCRPDCLNAEDNRQVADVETAVDLALLDPAVEVGVLRGGEMTHPGYRGRRVFSSGINLDELYAGRIGLVEFMLRRELGYLHKLGRGLHDDRGWWSTPAAKPWLAVVDGHAIGGGMQLLLVADHVIAASDAYLTLPAAQEGIVPGAANPRLTRHLGARGARQVILLGRRLRAVEPDARSLVDEVEVPGPELETAIRRGVDRLRGPSVVANRAMLLAAEGPEDTFRECLAEFAVHQALRLYSADMRAFGERREPVWEDR